MVLIVGAEITGLASAIAIKNIAKRQVQIVDSKSFGCLNPGRSAVLLSPNGLRALSYFVGTDNVAKVGALI